MSDRSISVDDAVNLAVFLVHMSERARVVGMFIDNARASDELIIDGITYQVIVKVKRGE